MRSLYWLCYRVGGSFKGLVLLVAESRDDAWMRAELEDLSPGGDCESCEVGTEEAKIIPSKFIGKLLGKDEVAELEKIVLTNTPKKPPSLWPVSDAQRRRAGYAAD
jgi:hypothetical protein